jgi:alkylation response protein AidB-like acyl-CoA dehydrogenase
MAQVIADRRDVDFVLFEQLAVEMLSDHERYADFNRKTIEMIVSEARNLAVKEIYPTQQEGDSGCTFEDGKVTVPDCYHRPWEMYLEGEWLAMPEDPNYGGQGMPRTVAMAANDFPEKDVHRRVDRHHAADRTRSRLRRRRLTTTASQKRRRHLFHHRQQDIHLFGEHDLAKTSFTRCWPASKAPRRAPRAFPFSWFPSSGSTTTAAWEFNDVVCTGIEEKMGLHGNATCSLTLGGKGRAAATLLGEENKGMRAMFLMMNEARLLVGMQGFACASSSYLNALNYARERVQGKNLLQMMDKDAPSVPIIQHPDVRRHAADHESLCGRHAQPAVLCGLICDRHDRHDDDDRALKAKYQGMIDVLIPIAKGYVTDRAFEVCNLGMQVYGGYGYIKEYPQEQLVRDCRITMIYEGTNGIQAMDLLGRKLGMNKGKPIMDLMGEIQEDPSRRPKRRVGLKGPAEMLEKALNKLGEVAMHMGATAMSPQVMNAFAFAHPFLEVRRCCHGLDAAVARGLGPKSLDGKAKKKDQFFYEGQIKSAEYFHPVRPSRSPWGKWMPSWPIAVLP